MKNNELSLPGLIISLGLGDHITIGECIQVYYHQLRTDYKVSIRIVAPPQVRVNRVHKIKSHSAPSLVWRKDE